MFLTMCSQSLSSLAYVVTLFAALNLGVIGIRNANAKHPILMPDALSFTEELEFQTIMYGFALVCASYLFVMSFINDTWIRIGKNKARKLACCSIELVQEKVAYNK